MLCEHTLRRFLNTVLVIFDRANIEFELSTYTIFVTLLIVSSNETFVYKLLISNVTHMSVFIGWNAFSFSTNSKLELIIQSLLKYGLSSISSHLHKAYSEVFIAERTGLSGQLVL